jgi:hypothetical protein
LTTGQVLILEANLVLLDTCCKCCYSVQNAQGIQKALVHLLIQSCATNIGDTVLDEESGNVQLENEETVILGSNPIPPFLAMLAKYATLEFCWSQIFFIF